MLNNSKNVRVNIKQIHSINLVVIVHRIYCCPGHTLATRMLFFFSSVCVFLSSTTNNIIQQQQKWNWCFSEEECTFLFIHFIVYLLLLMTWQKLRDARKREEKKKCPQTWCGPDWERSDESFWKSWNNIYAMLNELFDWCIISAGRDNVVRMAHAASIRLLPHIRHSIIIRIPSRKIKKYLKIIRWSI